MNNRGLGRFLPPTLIRLITTLHADLGGRTIGGAMLLFLSTSLSEGALVGMALPFLDNIIGAKELSPSLMKLPGLPGFSAAHGLLLCLTVLAIIRVSLNAGQELLMMRLAIQSAAIARIRLFQALCAADWRFLAERSHGEAANLLGQEIARVREGLFHLVHFPAHSLMLAIQLGLALWISVPATLGTILAVALILAVVRRRSPSAISHGAQVSALNADVSQDIEHFFATQKVAKAHEAEQWHTDRFSRTIQTMSETSLRFAGGNARTKVTLQIAATIILALMIAITTGSGHISGSESLILGGLLFRALPKIQAQYRGARIVAHSLPAFQAVMAMVDQAQAAATPLSDMKPAPAFQKSLSCRNISFRFKSDGPAVLSGLDLVIKRGELVILQGSSGGGKTTLADILSGLLHPTEGEVQIDGQPLTPAMGRDWRRRVAYVIQDPLLFVGTIRENLTWCAPGQGATAPKDDALWEVLRLSSAEAFVRALPQGLDSPLGPGGHGLSGGQKQRLSLARALLRHPDLLILDEPTGALDRETEAQLGQTIASLKGEMTILVVTHKTPEVWSPNQVVTLSGGRLIQSINAPG
ncbi:ATP-binding cassette domain-containing protein [Rhodospirillum sp. A1_3_36]|uniref:ATP-binding cassette domain-containing protein n=1 Tax=Rhodospirillum sp. A1_3_36 TaxID=3391666 RepID=UPI0039A56340